jgi:hypothetical protein
VLDATDASGLREAIALVYEDLDGEPGGPGEALAFSTGDISATPGPHTLVLPGALGKRISIQYIDGAGNLLLKSFKGRLFQAVPVEIRTSLLASSGSTSIVVFIGDFGALAAPVLSVDYGDGTAESFALVDANGSPTPIVQLQPDGSAIATVRHDYSGASGSVTVVATVSAEGAGGTDSATLSSCADIVGDFGLAAADIASCSFASQGTHVTFGLFMRGPIASDILYRVTLPTLGDTLVKYRGGTTFSSLPANLVVTPSGSTGLLFDFDAAAFGWDGVSAIGFTTETFTLPPTGPALADTAGEFDFIP